jgi:hypothetical protein
MAARRESFEVEQFEFVRASDDDALLRLAGRWPRGGGGECALVVVTGGARVERLEPLPTPPGPGGADVWRGAYSAPLALVEESGARWALETAAGRSVALPAPAERGKAAAAPEPHQTAEPVAPEAQPIATPSATDETQSARAAGFLARRRETQRALRAQLERSERATVELTDAIARAHEERERFLHWMESGEHANDRVQRERARRERAEQEAAALRERVAELEGLVARLRSGIEQGEQQITAIANQAEALRAAAADRPAPSALDGAGLEALRAEVDRGAERLAEMERQADALRTAIRARTGEGPPPDERVQMALAELAELT